MQFVNTSECVTYKWHCVDISSEKSQRKVFLQILYFHQHFLQKKKRKEKKQITASNLLSVVCGQPLIFKYKCPYPMSSDTERPRQPLWCLHLVTMFFQLGPAGRKEENRKIKSGEMITGGWLRHKYPRLLIVRTIKRWEWENI